MFSLNSNNNVSQDVKTKPSLFFKRDPKVEVTGNGNHHQKINQNQQTTQDSQNQQQTSYHICRHMIQTMIENISQVQQSMQDIIISSQSMMMMIQPRMMSKH